MEMKVKHETCVDFDYKETHDTTRLIPLDTIKKEPQSDSDSMQLHSCIVKIEPNNDAEYDEVSIKKEILIKQEDVIKEEIEIDIPPLVHSSNPQEFESEQDERATNTLLIERSSSINVIDETSLKTEQGGENDSTILKCKVSQSQKLNQTPILQINREDSREIQETKTNNEESSTKSTKITINVEILNHKKHETCEKLYACTFCQYKSNKPSRFQEHLRTHTGEKPFACSFCEYKCSVKRSLQQHQRTHTGEKPFACSLCEYRSIEKKNLQRHLCTHTGEKPFACTFCKYRSSVKIRLQKHLLTHTGEKPFVCNFCEYGSSEKRNLERHLRTHTGEKPFACTLCEYRSNYKMHLQQHIRSHTGEKPFACTQCEYKTGRKPDLQRHLRTHTEKHVDV